MGTRRVKGTHRPGPEPFHAQRIPINGIRPGGNPSSTYADADGRETVPAWECAPGCPVALLDAQSGERGNNYRPNRGQHHDGHNGMFGLSLGISAPSDSGGSSRFFPIFAWTDADDVPWRYVAKASRRERNEGLDSFPKSAPIHAGHGHNEPDNMTQRFITQPAANTHSTVKPLALMEWLCTLITPPGGVVLDPFLGSGTTGVAAVRLGFRFVGIEQAPDYLEIARARIAHAERRIAAAQAAPRQPVLLEVAG